MPSREILACLRPQNTITYTRPSALVCQSEEDAMWRDNERGTGGGLGPGGLSDHDVERQQLLCCCHWCPESDTLLHSNRGADYSKHGADYGGILIAVPWAMLLGGCLLVWSKHSCGRCSIGEDSSPVRECVRVTCMLRNDRKPNQC